MGLWKKLSQLLSAKKHQVLILCVGLDDSGKTTIMNKMKPEKEQEDDTAPTMGHSVQSFRYSNVAFTSFDMPGQDRYRSMWEKYYEICDAVIFVVDSSDRLRIKVAKEELDNLLIHPAIASRPRMPILFYANKRDVRNSMTAPKCAQLMGLDKGIWARTDSDGNELYHRPWYISSSNAQSGEGLEEGIKWISKKLVEQKNTRRRRNV